METFADYLESIVEEPIIYIVIGEMGGIGDFGSDDVPDYDKIPKGQVLSWENGRKWLAFQTSYEHGAPKQPAVYCYTENYVVFMSQHDGATEAWAIPRNPIDIMPEMPGG